MPPRRSAVPSPPLYSSYPVRPLRKSSLRGAPPVLVPPPCRPTLMPPDSAAQGSSCIHRYIPLHTVTHRARHLVHARTPLRGLPRALAHALFAACVAGTRFLIAFGLPGHANEDDESRAVTSSLAVLAALRWPPLRTATYRSTPSHTVLAALSGLHPAASRRIASHRVIFRFVALRAIATSSAPVACRHSPHPSCCPCSTILILVQASLGWCTSMLGCLHRLVCLFKSSSTMSNKAQK